MTAPTDLDAREALAERLVDDTTHTLEMLSIYLGPELGRYQALNDLGAATETDRPPLVFTLLIPHQHPQGSQHPAQHRGHRTDAVWRVRPPAFATPQPDPGMADDAQTLNTWIVRSSTTPRFALDLPYGLWSASPPRPAAA